MKINFYIFFNKFLKLKLKLNEFKIFDRIIKK